MPGYDVVYLKSNNTTRYDSAKLAIQAVPKLERGTKRIKERLFGARKRPKNAFSMDFPSTLRTRHRFGNPVSRPQSLTLRA